METSTQSNKRKWVPFFFYLQVILLASIIYSTINQYRENIKGGNIHDWIGMYLALYWLGMWSYYVSVVALSLIPWFFCRKYLVIWKNILYLTITVVLLIEPVVVYLLYSSISSNPIRINFGH
jgi:hypothetical protein